MAQRAVTAQQAFGRPVMRALRRPVYMSAGKQFKGVAAPVGAHSRMKTAPRGQAFESGHEKFEVRLTDFGMQGVGYILGGGFPLDSVYLMTGQTGSFYATFAQQALHDHVRHGGKVVYYTCESSGEDVEQDMATFKWAIDDKIDDGSWVFTRLIPPQLKAIVANTAEDPREQRIDLLPNSLGSLEEDFLERMKEGRWSAMSLSYLMKCYPAQEITDLVMFWTSAAHKLGGVHFLLMPTGVHDEATMNYIKSLVDGVMVFKFAQGFEQAEGEIEIEKMRRVIPKAKIVRHSVQDDGISVETTARVG